MSKKPRVLLADAHADFRRALLRYLEPEFEVLGAMPDGPSILEAIERSAPEVVLIELSAPIDEALALAGLILERSPEARVIFLSSLASPSLARSALSTGALAYVDKLSAAERLIPVIRAALWDRKGPGDRPRSCVPQASAPLRGNLRDD
jgi:two-component system response regulator DesR